MLSLLLLVSSCDEVDNTALYLLSAVIELGHINKRPIEKSNWIILVAPRRGVAILNTLLQSVRLQLYARIEEDVCCTSVVGTHATAQME